MKFHKYAIATLLALTVVVATAGAAVRDLPIKVVNGHPYHYYEVAPKETVYSLCHKLGLTKEELVKYNPVVADGLKAGSMLFFPAEEGDMLTPGNAASHGVSLVSHKVEKRETIYGIATRYGISTDALIEQNPIVRDGLKAGQTLHIKVPVRMIASSDSRVDADASAKSSQGYIVKKKETFYSIAREHGISVARLEAANPGISVLREGQVLSIPGAGCPEPVSESGMTVSTDSEPSVNAGEPVRKSDELSIAVILPFMLAEETPSKGALRYTEFYKGFLMAVDSLRNNGTPVRISAYDSEGSTEKVRRIISDPVLKSHRMIIAPDNAEQLALIGEFGRENGINVFNTFVVRDECYRANPYMMQGNIPSESMINKAVDAMAARLEHSEPVFLNVSGGANDKSEFVDALKKCLVAKGVTPHEINVETKLTPSDLKMLKTDGSYTFIPTSARQSDVNRLLSGLIEWRDESVMPTVRIMGYPEWITFKGETLDNMHNLNTIVYSRFFVDDDNVRTRMLEDKFKDWYGCGIENAVPRQGLLGFDTGMFLLNYLKNPASRYDGVQNGYLFVSPDGAEGKCNNVLYLVNFRPGGMIEKINL